MDDDTVLELSAIELRVDEYFVRDDLSIPDYPGPQLLAVAFANKVTALTPGGRTACTLPREVLRALHGAVERARGEEIREGIDTAIGRTLTRLRLDVRHARGPSASFGFEAIVNHCAPHALPPQWSAVLRGLRDALGRLPIAAAEAWDVALTWTSGVDLGPTWTAGGVVRLPHAVTAIEHDGPLFVRTGQLPGPSNLYRFDAAMLTCVEDRRVVPPLEHSGLRWRLPCGTGALEFHRELHELPRIVIRVDDPDRGIYVQKG